MGQIRDWGAMKEMCARLQISLTRTEEVDAEVLDWMQVAFEENS
jgi:hypothetical protein